MAQESASTVASVTGVSPPQEREESEDTLVVSEDIDGEPEEGYIDVAGDARFRLLLQRFSSQLGFPCHLPDA